MTEECFDIVDENNEPTGEVKSRAEVHKAGQDWHRASGIWIINSKKQILCQRRSHKKDVHPGLWQSFLGGHLKAGETYIQNAIGELNEELGLEISADDLMPLFIKKSDKMKHFSQIYILKLDKDEKDFKFNDGEVEQVGWFDIYSLKRDIEAGKFCNTLYPEVLDYMKVNS